ncbi:MAG: efflux RND transporter permease subunit [Kiritimatiellae bacterium]|nr:efflux RND transporter permease subunit [Kiritimatiellia bacterium]
MKSVSGFFVKRPKSALVTALVATALGCIGLMRLQIADYPEVTPTSVGVSTTYSGASPQVVADTVAAPIETEINAVDNVEYFESTCTDSGYYSLTVTFKAGTDPDINLVNVQNAVKRAEAKLPGEVVQLGLTVKKSQVNEILRFAFSAKDGGADLHLIGNFACKEVKEALQRVDGVSSVGSSSSGDYAMRIWLDPMKMDAMGISVFDVRTAIAQQNIQPAAGNVGDTFSSRFLSYKVNVRGRLVAPDEFAAIVVRADKATGARVLLGDIARCELGVQNYGSEPRLGGKPTFFLTVFRDPRANAVDVARRCRQKMDEWRAHLPPGSECTVMWDATAFTKDMMSGLERSAAIALAALLAGLLLFLGGVRRALVAALAIPFTLLGVLAFLAVTGGSLNVFSGFGLLAASGAIVGNAAAVVLAVRREMSLGLAPDEAAERGAASVAGGIATATVVSLACYLPIAFHGGMVGMMFAQFASTLSVALVLSAFASIALLPPAAARLCAGGGHWLERVVRLVAGPFARIQLACSRSLVAHPVLAAAIFAAIAIPSLVPYRLLPKSSVPDEDRGFVRIEAELSEGSSLMRTRRIVERAFDLLDGMPGVSMIYSAAGSSFLGKSGENHSELGLALTPARERSAEGLSLARISSEAMRRLSAINSATFTPLYLPTIDGLGSMGGVMAYICAVGEVDPAQQAADAAAYAERLRALPQVKSAISTFTADTPQLHLTVDRDKAQALGVPASSIFSTLQSKLASFYVNDFNVRGGAYQVVVQNDNSARGDVESALDTRLPAADGAMVPLSAVGRFDYMVGPRTLWRFNKLPSARIIVNPAEGCSTLDVIDLIEKSPPDPSKYVLNWSAMTYEERASRGRFGKVLLLSIALMYLLLTVKYESWSMPFAILAPSVAAVGGGLCGLWIAGEPFSVYAQLALLLLIEFPARGSIMVAELARRSQAASAAERAADGARRAFCAVACGGWTFAAALAALVFAQGIGAATQRALGIPLFSGVVASLAVGATFAPALYSLVARRSRNKRQGA